MSILNHQTFFELLIKDISLHAMNRELKYSSLLSKSVVKTHTHKLTSYKDQNTAII